MAQHPYWIRWSLGVPLPLSPYVCGTPERVCVCGYERNLCGQHVRAYKTNNKSRSNGLRDDH